MFSFEPFFSAGEKFIKKFIKNRNFCQKYKFWAKDRNFWSTNLNFVQISEFWSQIEIFVKNGQIKRHFRQKWPFLRQFLFTTNFHFCQKFRSLGKISLFLLKFPYLIWISFLDKNFPFWPKLRLLTKISILRENSTKNNELFLVFWGGIFLDFFDK